MHIREFAEEHVGPACTLTNHYIEHTHVHFATDPATYADFRAYWRAGVEAAPVYPWLAAEGDERSAASVAFAGYAKASEFRSRAAYRATAETAIYVAREWQGRGVGRALYRALLARLGELGYHRAVAGIALPNEGSVRLHEAAGFRYVGTFREVGRKFGAWCDVGFWEASVGA